MRNNSFKGLKGSRFPSLMRLNTREVCGVLKRGLTVRCQVSAENKRSSTVAPKVSLKILARRASKEPIAKGRSRKVTFGRIAISVPKKLVRSAVARNRIKRWVREAFRKHDLRYAPVDVLVMLNAKVDGNNIVERSATKDAIEYLFWKSNSLTTVTKLPVR